MDVATSVKPVTNVGVREMKNNLSKYLGLIAEGEEVVITDRGRPVARLVAIDGPSNRLQELIDAGLVRPAASSRRPLPTPIQANGTVSDLVAEQRR